MPEVVEAIVRPVVVKVTMLFSDELPTNITGGTPENRSWFGKLATTKVGPWNGMVAATAKEVRFKRVRTLAPVPATHKLKLPPASSIPCKERLPGTLGMVFVTVKDVKSTSERELSP